ncbi:unnamed protein product [Paramecium primaurelia]|uniref:HOOK N-terminal domain-containing protein n=1 Tax=Paramecium primaurelia TaxID=5886 RepID=A0A8S1L1B4_PARPR|nr:unnamed protein product [Paramecium primaurelia]
MSLENAIVQWLNKYQQLKIQSFESLADGCTFSQLLNLVDPTFFSLASAKNLKIDTDVQKVQGHLIDMLQKVQQYRTNIQCKPPDYIEIDVFEITVNQNKQQILALFELIMKVILSSNQRGKFIEPILMLEEKDQETLMHFLKNHLDESEENQTNEWQEENYIQNLVQKMDEIESYNIELKKQLNESEEKKKSLKCALDDALVQIENKDMEIRALTESKCHLEKCLEEKMDFQHEYKESEKIHQKCLEQEHKLAQYELIIEDLKRKETQFIQLKEEYQQHKFKLQENEKLEQKIESLQERRELDKDVYQKGKERYEKEITTLKQNIKELLLQQSELKESKLNLELELQQKQARFERSQEQIKIMETEYGQKIRELQDLLETLHQVEEEMPKITSSNNQQLSQEMKLSVNMKNENFEREYYIKENHKLEEKIKELQAKINEMQMEEESKNQKSKFESQLQQSQQISLLTDKIKQFQEHNQQLKKQNEELKKQTQNKKVTQIDYEISVLSLLSEALAKKVKEYKSQEKDQ